MLTDAEEQKGEQCDRMATKFPAQRARLGCLLGCLHGGVLVVCVAGSSCECAARKLAACHQCSFQERDLVSMSELLYLKPPIPHISATCRLHGATRRNTASIAALRSGPRLQLYDSTQVRNR